MFSQGEREGQRGQGLVEYALIMVLVAVVVMVALVLLGPALSGVYCNVIQELNPNSNCTTAAAVAPEEQGDEEQQPQSGIVSASYNCVSDERIQFHAYYGSDVSPFYASSIYQCAPGSSFHIDVPYESGRHGDLETDRISPNPMMLADVPF